MNVLIACEFSGAVRDAFIARGHNAWSCDLLPTESGTQHFQADCLVIARAAKWDLIIAHPPCTYLSSSGLHWNGRRPGRAELTEQALQFVRDLMELDCQRIAIENPTGCISTRIRKPDQIIQPYQFGDDASKATCLWLNGLPKLSHTTYFPPRIVDGKPRWGNQTDSGQNRLPPSKHRAAERARTYPGIAKAMAEQWG